MTLKNKDTVIKDIQSQKENAIVAPNEKTIENQEIFSILFRKIEQDALNISQLTSTKNELLTRISELEQENMNMKTKYVKQEIEMKSIVLRENTLKKELEAKTVFEKLAEGRISGQLLEKNNLLQSKLDEYQQESLSFREKYENTEQSYKILKGCFLGTDFSQDLYDTY